MLLGIGFIPHTLSAVLSYRFARFCLPVRRAYGLAGILISFIPLNQDTITQLCRFSKPVRCSGR
jgi:hypothetical protein